MSKATAGIKTFDGLHHSPLTCPAPLPSSAHAVEITKNALHAPLPATCSSLIPTTCHPHSSASGTPSSQDLQSSISVLFRNTSPSSALDCARNMERSTVCSMSEWVSERMNEYCVCFLTVNSWRLQQYLSHLLAQDLAHRHRLKIHLYLNEVNWMEKVN